MRIYLADLNYLYEWDHIRPVPLGVGYIGAYLKARIPDLEVEIFKDPAVLLGRLSDSPPDVLALSHYEWNSNLDFAVLKRTKQASPSVITVMGGPNFHADEPEWLKQFFGNRPFLDLYISGEGEWSFFRLIKLLMEKGRSLNVIPVENWPGSFFGYDHQRGEFINNPMNTVERLDLMTVPSPYLTGLMDPFLEDRRLSAIIETNRGCPYSCAFCCWGNATQSKVNQFNLQTVQDEISYLSEKSRNPAGLLYIADANFGILKRDQQIADHLSRCVERHGFPKRIINFYAKNAKESVLNIAEAIKDVAPIGMARQSLNDEVLEIVRRKNIHSDVYDSLRDECETRGLRTTCDLIYGLPGESYESFVAGVSKMVRGRETLIAIYPHILIAGAETSKKAYRKKYGIKSAFRIQMRAVGMYDDVSAMEYEEFVVETKDFPFADFFRIRTFHFLFVVLGDRIFRELRHALFGCGSDYAEFANFIVNDEKNWSGRWRTLMRDFQKASKDQLLSEDELKLEFSKEDVNQVLKHQIALNPKFMARLVADRQTLEDFKDYLFGVLHRIYEMDVSSTEMSDLIYAAELSFETIIDYTAIGRNKTIECDYDIGSWLSAVPYEPLEDFKSPMPRRCKLYVAPAVAEAFKRAEKFTSDIAEAIYVVRINMMSMNSYDIYSYVREPEGNLPSA